MFERVSHWEEAYRKVESLWGFKPDHMLVRYARLIPDGRVLDLGVGEGRNALFLAKAGYEVEGYDVSQTAVDRCMEMAQKEGLSVMAQASDLREVDIPQGRYSLVLASWVLHLLKKTEAVQVISKIKNGLISDGIVYMTVFSTEDPFYVGAREKDLDEVEENTFYLPERDTYMHFFTQEEICSLFSDFGIVYCASGTALDFGHGDRGAHRHGFVEYMGQKLATK